MVVGGGGQEGTTNIFNSTSYYESRGRDMDPLEPLILSLRELELLSKVYFYRSTGPAATL